MANTSASARSGGIGLLGLTFVALLIMKLGFAVNISWFIVFLPLIIGAAFIVIVLGIVGIVTWLALR